jgi:fatty acid desaturase
MNDPGLRHVIAIVATLIVLLAFWAGYIAGGHGWWWVAFGMLVVYGAVYKIVDAGGHH